MIVAIYCFIILYFTICEIGCCIIQRDIVILSHEFHNLSRAVTRRMLCPVLYLLCGVRNMVLMNGILDQRTLPDKEFISLWEAIILDQEIKDRLLLQAVLNFTLRPK